MCGIVVGMAIKGYYTMILTYNGQTDEILNVPINRNGFLEEDDDDLMLVFELYKDSHRLPLVVSVKSGSICTELPSECNKGSNVANASNELPGENVANASNELPSENVSNASNVIDGLGT
ncbi:hypothetical protein GH714_022475 [Hevea brasiliensis]|uniref:Uncharacterized protein n=1 Tax=Hevea brasiliensis TaxID=3981 RepID=A0A6A6LCP8_HEVBR|nr:hypothetical protein GH714_022475 [Hevea brasiliensis]